MPDYHYCQLNLLVSFEQQVVLINRVISGTTPEQTKISETLRCFWVDYETLKKLKWSCTCWWHPGYLRTRHCSLRTSYQTDSTNAHSTHLETLRKEQQLVLKVGNNLWESWSNKKNPDSIRTRQNSKSGWLSMEG